MRGKIDAPVDLAREAHLPLELLLALFEVDKVVLRGLQQLLALLITVQTDIPGAVDALPIPVPLRTAGRRLVLLRAPGLLHRLVHVIERIVDRRRRIAKFLGRRRLVLEHLRRR